MSKSYHPGLFVKPDFTHLVIGMLVFGALWGMSEVALGGILGTIGFPYRAGLLTGIGMGILALAYAIYRNATMLLGIGLVAAAVNLLGVPILHLTIMCKANSLIAIGAEVTSLSVMVAILMRKSGGNVYLRMACGGAAAILASVGFYLIGTHVAPCQYLSTFANTGAFVVKEGLVWAAFAAIFVPLGYIAGEKLSARFPAVNRGRTIAYYAGVSGIFIVSIAVSSLAVVAGL